MGIGLFGPRGRRVLPQFFRHRTQQLSVCDVQVMLRRFQVRVSEEQLDRAEISYDMTV